MRAAIYARQSLDRNGEALAVTRQLAECRDLAAGKGWEVVREYVDNDTSASSGKPRPQWDKLLTDLTDGLVDVLVCWHTDRLYRRLRDLVGLVEIAERRSLRIASVKAADLDLSTPAGRMLAGMLGHAARYEVEQKSARQCAANLQRARMGNVGWTRRPYGYDRVDGSIVVVDTEAAVIRRMASAVLSGASLSSVAAMLNDEKITTSLGGPWNVNGIKRVLINPRHAGQAVYRGERVADGAWPAILDTATHERLVAVLTAPGRRTTTSNVGKHLLSGIARCGRCGAPMYATPTGVAARRWLAYRCSASAHLMRRLDLVDEVVNAVVIARLRRPDVLQLLAPTEDVSALAVESTEIRGRLDDLAALLADGILSAAGVRDAASRLHTRLRELQGRIGQAVGTDALAGLADADDVAAWWAGVDLAHQRAVIERLMVVTILPAGRGARFTQDQVKIEWRRT